jgi:hypothetical protein
VSDALPFLAVLAIVLAVAVLGLRGLMSGDGRRNRRGPGAGATGAVYDMLNEDKRKAIEIILEERTAYKDPEHADDKPKTGENSTKEG